MSTFCVLQILKVNKTKWRVVQQDNAFVECVLVNDLPFPFCPVEDDTSPTPDPEPSQPSPRQMELQPDSTTDTEPDEDNLPVTPNEPYSAPEPEPNDNWQQRQSVNSAGQGHGGKPCHLFSVSPSAHP